MEIIIGLFIIIAILITCAIISSIISSTKGDNFFGGVVPSFIVGLLLGPLGLIIIAFTAGKKCLYCKKRINGKATICPYCQKSLVEKPK